MSALLPASAGAAEPRVISHEADGSVLSAYGGVVAWSSFDPQTRRYALRLLIDGQVRTPALKTRGVPFDVDLGPDRSGNVVAVYSRCRQEPQALQPNGLPGGDDGRGCDLYKLDPRSGVERRLAGSSSAASEYFPTIWRDQVAFARVYERRRGLRGVLPYLYVRDQTPGSRSQRRPGGTRGYYEPPWAGGRYEGGPGPVSLDLRGRRLSFAWRYERREPCPGTQSSKIPFTSRSEIWVDDRRIRRGCTDQLHSPQLGAGRVSYLIRPVATPSASWITSPLDHARERFERLALGDFAASAAEDQGLVYSVEDDPDVSGWRVVSRSSGS